MSLKICRENKNIFNKCYKLKKTGVINNVWSNYGVVSIQLNNDEVIDLRHFDDINYYLQDCSNYSDESISGPF